MLTDRPAPNSFLRIVLTVLAVLMIAGCGAEGGSSQAGAGNTIIGGSNSGNSGGNGGGSVTSTGSFSLSWTAPVSRQDGSPMSLAEIEGYRVYYGGTPGNYQNIVDINDGAASVTTVSNVPMGNYYIVMTTYDSNGLESTQSGMVSKQAL